MLQINLIKRQIKAVVVDKLSTIDGVCSITFVGSFEFATDISFISDIDVIVVVDKIYAEKFKEIEFAANSIKGSDFSLDEYEVKLNMTFGPLKLNDKKTIVLHLMIYDIEGHRRHVLESPFTCLDWEFFPSIYGKNLSEIYPASGVQFDDLFGSRRGLESYLDDLKNQVISYREYDFSTEPYTEKRNVYKIDDRHQKEYAYHVLKFLQVNLIKILFQENKKYSIYELCSKFSTLKHTFKNHSEFLLELHKWKYDDVKEPDNIFERLQNFISDLSSWLNELNLPQISFFRHGKTLLNDGSFLGVRRNPSILNETGVFCKDYFDEVYTSTLKRAIETGRLLRYDEIYEDELLNEIDYGLAEGLKFEELVEKFPHLIELWKNNEDPKFPEGENYSDVQNRLNKFLKKGFSKNKIAIVTHNVVLRVLVGSIYNQPIYNWYKINHNHHQALNFKVFNNVLIPNFTKEQRMKYKDEIVGFKKSIVKYAIFWIPRGELNQYVQSWKSRFRELESDAVYLNHPVHSTIFMFNGYEEDQSEIINSIKSAKINFKLEGWKIFENDLLTKSDTLVLAFKPDLKVFEFQKNLAEALLKFIREPFLYKNEWEGIYKESYDRYGFPFVGQHWIPHITIASFKNKGKSLFEQAKSAKINLNQEILEGRISLFKIFGETHKHVYTWN